MTAGTGRDARPGFDRRLIAPMILGSILNPINSSMLAVALIPIGQAFGAPPSETAWLVSALYLATAIGQPVIGRLVDAFGPRPLYLIGTGLVGFAGLLGVVAPTLGVLIASRVLLGFGTSAAYPASMSLLRTESDRTGMRSPAGILAALSIANQVVAVIGPTLGGVLIGLGGWHLIFAINVPLSLACLALGALRLPRRPRRTADDPPVRVDVVGMAWFAATLTTFLLFLMDPGLAQWWLLALAGIAALGFVRRERHVDEPFLDLRVLRGNGPLLATYGRQVLAYTVSYGFMYGFTQWLEDGRGMTPAHAGLLMLPMSLSAIAVTVLVGRRPGVRGKLVAGSVTLVAACASILLLTGSSPVGALVGVGVLLGVPQGLNGLANQNALYAQADPDRMGSSAGLLRTFMYLGAMVAAATNAAFYADGATTAGLHDLGAFMLVVAVLLVVAVVADRSLGRYGYPGARPSSGGRP
ncbi:putative MFS family arabinose efflux permease [Sediminihabitans luteus]|uniref:Putative MFS family arabinose efflux permease n=1 Tax=Sediminihabitans luteus TaxID=1138585 RepID=A0A2M9CEJ4_9CELL|nr:MFS transporter [Sediminihabitans luteus]PJJ70351.1 putative MFS family arabinose efflux permease [Sediminihabitans luteus]GII97823.1 MFS transporter [Sediminihabitans luteus]